MEPSGCNSPVKCPSSPSVKTNGKRVMTPNLIQSRSLISVDKSTSHRQSKASGRELTNIQWRSKDELIKSSREQEWKAPPSCSMEHSMLPENVSARLVDSMSKLTIYSEMLAQLGESSEDKEDVPVVSKKRKFKEGSGKERGKRKRVTFSDEVRTIKYREPDDCTVSKDEAEDQCTEVQRTEVQHTEIQHPKVQRTEVQHTEVSSAVEVQHIFDRNLRKTPSRLLIVAMQKCRASTSRDEDIDCHECRPC